MAGNTDCRNVRQPPTEGPNTATFAGRFGPSSCSVRSPRRTTGGRGEGEEGTPGVPFNKWLHKPDGGSAVALPQGI